MSHKIITFGCRLNSFESEMMDQALQQAELGSKQTIVLNSCAVTKEAERQLRQTIRRERRLHPDARVVVTGCAAQISPDFYMQMEEVDAVIGNQEKFTPANYEPRHDGKMLVNDIMSVRETATHLVHSFEGKSRAFIEIQNGCNHRCTFCIIPFGRGNSRSVPLGELVKGVSQLVKQGYQEVVLTGVDITGYGLDLPGQPTLGEACQRLLNSVPELPRLRLSSIDVAEIDPVLLRLITEEPRFMPYLHLSLQAGDNMILKRMKRRHTREQVIEFYQHVMQQRPSVTFGADIIAGFPTETESMFDNTLALLEEVPIIFTHIFPYSEREGTPAAKMPPVEKSIRKERAKKLREAGERNLQKRLQLETGKSHSVIIEQHNMARTEHFLECQLPENHSYPIGSIQSLFIDGYKDGRLVVENPTDHKG